VDYFRTRPEVYAIPKKEASTVADALMTNFFCHLGVPMELDSDQGSNLESRLLQEVMERLKVRKTGRTPLHPVRWDDGALREDDQGALEEGGLFSPTGMG
jgi:Mn-dependent DtxR family transcriptional regulator